uniref:histidine kinase n=1 Tax=Candidatus Endohaliclona renieramycinifaciens TaxID=2565582 RepID=A0A4D6G3A0_9GAMM|nr:putative sensor histidine kinase [Candidatus Endohaliclona renieramycinifaciens]
METAKVIVEIIFSLALFINALLFIPQMITIIKKKSAEGVSLLTFLGFLVIQFSVILHGIINQDYMLAIGYFLSFLTCGLVVFLLILYQKNNIQRSLKLNVVLEKILEQLPAHIYWKDKQGILLGCNTKNWKDFGVKSLSEYLGKTDYDWLPFDQANKIRQVDQEVIVTGKSKILEEIRNTIDGKNRIYLSHKAPLKKDDGSIMGILGVSFDITKIRKAEMERFEMLENIIALMPGHVYWVNREGYYLGCNDNQAKSAGLYSRKEIIGKRNKDLPWNFSVEMLPETLDKINEQVMDTVKSIAVEEPAILQDGTEAIFLSNKVPLCNKEYKVIGMVGISINITERKENEKELMLAKEQAELASKLKDEFILNMEHDIRTPLSAINMVAAQLSKNEIDLNKNKKLINIVVCSKEIMDYCYRTIEYLKIKFSSVPMIEKKFNLRDLVKRVINIEKPAYDSKKLDFNLEIKNNIPEFLVGDDFRLERILINLLNNAVKFTHNGFVKLTVQHIKELDNRNIAIQFIVEDSGIGIPEDKLNIIYEEFARMPPSSQALYKGQGLGLTVVRKLTEEMEGEIDVKSMVGKGTKFICTYPFKKSISE